MRRLSPLYQTLAVRGRGLRDYATRTGRHKEEEDMRIFVTGATGFFLPWVGQTMVMTWTGLFWHGQYPILGGYLIAINADCAGSSWQANLGVNGSPQVGTAIYGFTPINFSYTFNNGAGSDITVQFG